MIVRENVPLAALTTLRVGGAARYVASCTSEEDVREALVFAQEHEVPWRVLGGGSNVLASDEGFPGVIIHMQIDRLAVVPDTDHVFVFAGAGVVWDDLVHAAAAEGLWGIENLAGIPGTVGAAPVQNIGAYGTELKDTLYMCHALDVRTGEVRKFMNEDCEFGYRESRFKHDKNLIILSLVLTLHEDGMPQTTYKDLATYAASGALLSTPEVVGDAVRAIRARKFPDVRMFGTAGSFFKNPVVSTDVYEKLRATHTELPGFPQENGVKIPLAFILDKVLGLRGYREGNVALFSEQPLVLVTDIGASAQEVDAFAQTIAARVYDATAITIEREVQNIF